MFESLQALMSGFGVATTAQNLFYCLIGAIPGSLKPVILFLVVMALATLFFNFLGYPLIAFLLMATLLKILGMRRWPANIVLSLATAAASYFLFVQWLKIPLPKGWLGI